MREDIVSFVRDENRNYVFFLEMTGISWCDGTYRITRVNSPITVLEYVMQGKGIVTTNGKTFTASKGDVYMLQKGSDHNYFSDSLDPWVKIWINVDGPLVDSLVWNYGLNTLNHVPGLDMMDLFEEIAAIVRSGQDDADGIFSKVALVFHSMVARIHAAVCREESVRPPEAVRLKSWLDQHIYSRTNIEEFAGQIFRSPSQAIRIFKKQFGMTPYDYLLGKRIETAKLLLHNTNMQIKEIAFKLNFADEHYFSNYFKKRTGASPVQFRLRQR